MTTGNVYVQTNESENAVIAYRRAAEGGLTRLGSFATGGGEDARPHLTSQGSVVRSSDVRYLLVSNVTSDDVTCSRSGKSGSSCSDERRPAPRRRASPSTTASCTSSAPASPA